MHPNESNTACYIKYASCVIWFCFTGRIYQVGLTDWCHSFALFQGCFTITGDCRLITTHPETLLLICCNFNPSLGNYIHYTVWDEITFPFPNFNGATVEVWKWISNYRMKSKPQWNGCHIIVLLVIFFRANRKQSSFLMNSLFIATFSFDLFHCKVSQYRARSQTKFHSDWVKWARNYACTIPGNWSLCIPVCMGPFPC